MLDIDIDEFSGTRANPPEGSRKYDSALVVPHRRKLGEHAYLVIPDSPNTDLYHFFNSAPPADIVDFFRAAGRVVADLHLGTAAVQALMVINAVSPDAKPNNTNSRQHSMHMHLVLSTTGRDMR